MKRIETGCIATFIIGMLWMALAVIYGTEPADTIHSVAQGAGIAVAGMAFASAARWWDQRK